MSDFIDKAEKEFDKYCKERNLMFSYSATDDIKSFLRSKLEEQEKKLLGTKHGRRRCPKCGFYQISTNINAHTGKFSANKDDEELCPNDGSFMETVSLGEYIAELEKGQDVLVERLEEQHEIIKDLVWQYADRSSSPKGAFLNHGFLSAMESAFDYLGWETCHYCPDQECQEGKCREWATCGTPTKDGYKRLCGEHYRKVNNASKR